MIRQMRATAQFNGFPREAFDFFKELARHNNREWFRDNQDLYERVCREPMKRLVAELGTNPASAKISRINRDVRFSRDRSPYRTYIAAGTGTNYIHLSAEGLYVGTGLYKLTPAAVKRFRSAIDREASGRVLERIVRSVRRKHYRVDTHEQLASAPRGYSADHPRIELLRMKDIFAGKMFAPEPWLSTRRALQRIRHALKDVAPLAEWLRIHVGGRQ